MFTGKREEERGAEASEEPQEEGDHGQVGETQRCVLWSEVARLCSYVSRCSVASLCDPEVTGAPSVGFREEDLEEDFDPARYDETMRRVFSEQYDSMPVDTEKPVFSDSEGEGEFISTVELLVRSHVQSSCLSMLILCADQWWPGWEEEEEEAELHCEDRDFNVSEMAPCSTHLEAVKAPSLT